MNQRARAGDAVTAAGNPLPWSPTLHLVGTIAAYLSNLDALWLPSAMSPPRPGLPAAVLCGYQVTFGTPGVGASGADSLRLQLIDQSAEVAGAGTVSTSGTALTGSSTAFTSFFRVGDYIRSGAQTIKITAIASATAATLEAAPSVDWSSAAYVRVPTISTLATISLTANIRQLLPADLRGGTGNNRKGILLYPGQGLRLDSTSISTGGSQPADLRVKLFLGSFGLDG